MNKRIREGWGGMLLTLAAAAACCSLANGSAAAQGATVFINPQTGTVTTAFTPGASALTLSPAEQNAASTSSEDFVGVVQPDGSTKVDFLGRFQSPLVGYIDPQGRARFEHMPDLPPVPGVQRQ